MDDFLYVFTTYLFALKLLLYLTASLVLLSSLDDLFIDLYFIIRHVWRKIFIYSRHPSMQVDDLNQHPEKPLAIMIPAWQEAKVIGQMLQNTLQAYDYQNYYLFVGLYGNDPEGLKVVQDIAQQSPQVHPVLLPHDGPTCKADCLNHIYAAIKQFEQTNDQAFAGYILHDAEDIVHPLELKLYNHLLPRMDMIQLPVIPLERPWWDFTGGHYQDEFAENHGKDLVVRESLTGHVPSAGVGCLFSHHAMEKITQGHAIQPFQTGNLTEDYDFAIKLQQLGLRQVFVRFNITGKAGKKHDVIATREYFPNSISTAVRQKSRWLMGIVFQNWRSMKWPGGWRMKYALMRDRKGIFTAQLAILGYFVLLNILLVWGIEKFHPAGYEYPPLVRTGEPLYYILLMTLCCLVNRALQRAFFCYQLYGLQTAALSLPRQIWGNVINFLASIRAIYFYSRHLINGQPLVWDKTDHEFPDIQALKPFRRRLGEILLSENLIEQQHLQTALEAQRANRQPLGQILVQSGFLNELDLNRALQQQENEEGHEHPH